MISSHRFNQILLVFTLFIFVIFSPFSVVTGEEKQEKKDEVVVNEEQRTTRIAIYSWATILPKELIDLQNKISKEKRFKLVAELLPKLTEETDELRWDTTTAQTSPELQLFQVASLLDRTQKVGSRLSKITESINGFISSLLEDRKEWLKKKEDIADIAQREEILLVLEKEQYEKLLETVEEALRLIEEQLKSVLTVGKKIGDLQVVLYTIDSDLQELDVELKEISTQQTAPSMLSAEFYSRINYNLFSQSFNRTKFFILDSLESMQKNLRYVILGSLGFVLICFVIYKTRGLAGPDSRWQQFAKRPFATAIFMVSSINAITNILPLNTDLPERWEALLHVITLFAVMRLTKYIVTDKGKRKFLNQLSFFMAMTMILILLGLPQTLILLYVFYVSIVAFVYYLTRLRSVRGQNSKEAWMRRIWGVFPAIVIISGMTGYDQLAVMFFSDFLSTIISSLIVWVLYLFHLGFLELFLSILPFMIVRKNIADIIKSVKPIIALLHILMLITIQSVIWGLYPTINIAFSEINNFGFAIGNIHVSLKFILTVGIVFYGALLTSKAIQAFLLKNVLPRYNAEKGVQLSIVRLAHYATLTIGFLVMLRVLGFQLNQITLLGGALGVGIGFGLQAIVNNFASGLILLFERPIKVGDTIQIGTEYGEVKQLGLRATIIQTFDNAEIVVPNSDLITGQVTNWTLADRKVRVKVPIGVAYGSDVNKVLEILVSCGKANPMVLYTPAPNALFLAFGASSLDFELRVWIPEFLDKLQVLSELNQDIENEFAINDIVIPFPQTDLHLKSVDEKVAELSSFRTLQPGDDIPR